jgi:hypothetical protein
MEDMIGELKADKCYRYAVIIGKTLVIVGLLVGYVNTDVFTCWIKEFLIPNL